MEHELSSARPLRDALVRRLTTAPSPGVAPAAWLVQIDAVGASLHLAAEGRALVLFLWPGDAPDALESLRNMLNRVLASAAIPGAEIALVGGGEAARSFLQAVRPPPRFGFHQVDLDGALWSRRGRLPVLEQAAKQVTATGAVGPLLTHPEVVAAQTAFHALAETETRFREVLARRRPLATYALIGACLAVFALEFWWSGGANMRTTRSLAVTQRMGATDATLIAAGEVWRLLASAFLHADLIHIGVNMWSLWALGRFLERLLGSARFLVLYGLAAIGGSGLSAWGHPDTFSVGASGAIFGLMGGLAAIVFLRGHLLPASLVASLKRSLWQPFLLNVFLSLLPQVDALAHLGGGLVGVALVGSGLLVSGLPGAAHAERGAAGLRAWNLAAAVMAVAMVAAVTTAIVRGRPWELAGTPSMVRTNLPATVFSLAVPFGTLPREHHAAAGGLENVLRGAGRFDPFQVTVTLEKSDLLTPDADDWQQVGGRDAGEERLEAPSVVPLGGHETLLAVGRDHEGTRIVRAVTYRDGFRAAFHVSLGASLPAAWDAAAREVVASLARRPDPAR